MFNKLKELRENCEDGFTLIELLVVILIIGILAAIAIPVFLNQRQVAIDASVESDVKNAANAIENWSVKNSNSPIPNQVIREGGTATASGESGASQNTLAFINTAAVLATVTTVDSKASSGNTVFVKGNGKVGEFCIYGVSPNGKASAIGAGITYDSTNGGLKGKGGACATDGDGNVIVPADVATARDTSSDGSTPNASGPNTGGDNTGGDTTGGTNDGTTGGTTDGTTGGTTDGTTGGTTPAPGGTNTGGTTDGTNTKTVSVLLKSDQAGTKTATVSYTASWDGANTVSVTNLSVTGNDTSGRAYIGIEDPASDGMNSTQIGLDLTNGSGPDHTFTDYDLYYGSATSYEPMVYQFVASDGTSYSRYA